MEWAIHLGQGNGAEHWRTLLSQPERSCEPPLRGLQAAVGKLLFRYDGAARPSRAYIGSEFCPQLIPSLARLSEVCRTLRQQGLDLTLLTPPVTDPGLAKLRTLFAWLASQDHPAEVVFNDWGVLHLLRHEFPRLRPVQGRLLSKTLRDPRVTPMYNRTDTPEGTRAAMQQTNLTTQSLHRLFRQNGVELVQLDVLLQGFDVDFRRLPFGVAVYFPYGFVTTGRTCMIGSLHRENSERFQPSLPCQQECQHYLTVHRFVGSALLTNGTAFYQCGNTFFYSPEAETLESFLSTAETHGVRRLVYEPRLPV